MVKKQLAVTGICTDIVLSVQYRKHLPIPEPVTVGTPVILELVAPYSVRVQRRSWLLLRNQHVLVNRCFRLLPSSLIFAGIPCVCVSSAALVL